MLCVLRFCAVLYMFSSKTQQCCQCAVVLSGFIVSGDKIGIGIGLGIGLGIPIIIAVIVIVCILMRRKSKILVAL